jgi:ribosomal protein S16
MNPNIKRDYDEYNDVWGLPQIYKGIKFYPIKLVDNKYYTLFQKLFTYPKNYIPDKNILKMSYLKYLLYVIQNAINPNGDGSELSIAVIDFLKHVTKQSDVDITWEEDSRLEGLEQIIFKIIVGTVVLDENDFDNIREILLEQNGLSIEYIEEYNPELEEKLKFVVRDSNDITLQDEIFTFCALMNVNIDAIKVYTFYQFRKQLERFAIIKEHDLYRPLEASGQIKLKNGEIKHWLSHVSKTNRYHSIMIEKERFMGDSGLNNVSDGIIK